MESVCVGYISEPPKNQMTSEVGQYDLFGALEAKLAYSNLIRNISPMQWNLGSPIYIKLFLGDGPTGLFEIRS